jgi:hypothetical protein
MGGKRTFVGSGLIPNYRWPHIGLGKRFRRQPNLFKVRLLALDLHSVEAHFKIVLQRLYKLVPPQEAVLHDEAVLRAHHPRCGLFFELPADAIN